MCNKVKILLVVLSVFSIEGVIGQEVEIQDSTQHELSVGLNGIQIKDQFNYGLVFNGLDLSVGYIYTRTFETSRVQYEADLRFGANFNKGVGLNWKFKPVDIFWGFDLPGHPGYIGGYIADIYSWQLYPELQSGHLYWITSIEIGPEFNFTIPYRTYILELAFSNSIAGFVSRPQPSTETYYYSLSLGDFIDFAHQGLELATLNRFNHSSASLLVSCQDWNRLTIGYNFEYFGYYKNPKWHSMNHHLSFRWKIARK